ncbi:MAG: hypothetical protein HUU46_22085 [Candidatus Hydrogenedentes bacterium]|nr:hypothetical protein [Candidatus Hydrogenedentota bacterium]
MRLRKRLISIATAALSLAFAGALGPLAYADSDYQNWVAYRDGRFMKHRPVHLATPAEAQAASFGMDERSFIDLGSLGLYERHARTVTKVDIQLPESFDRGPDIIQTPRALVEQQQPVIYDKGHLGTYERDGRNVHMK